MASTRPATRVRSEIPEGYTWDLSHIYSDWQAWSGGLDELQRLMDAYQSLKGTLAEGPDRLLEACRRSDELGQLAYRVYQLPSLTQAQDTRDNEVQARLEQVRIAFAKFRQATAWYTPELIAVGEETVTKWLDDESELATYRFPITEVFRTRRHILDEDGERLLAFAGPFGGTPSQTYTMMADADVRFPEVELSDGSTVVASHANYANGLRSRRLQSDREALFRAHFSVYDGAPNSFAAVYHGVLQRDWFVAQSRRYSSTVEASLDGNDIPVAVIDNLIATARAGTAALQRYHRLRRRILGVERYRYFDAYLPLVEVDWPMPYDDVAPLVIDSVAIFGDGYRETVQTAFNERWIDVYENDGKRSGAFSAGVYGVHPYMLLNHADTLNDAFTVAHEMGHTMHTVLSHRHQPFATAEYTIFVAEVASMTSEEALLQLLLERETDPLRRAVLLQHALDDIAAGFFRQTMFAEYELEAHRMVERGEPITAEVLQRCYLEVIRGHFADTLDDQEWYRNGWASIPHFYGSPYYVYQYATSKAAASLLYRRMTDGRDADRAATRDRYLELLRSGGNDHPVEQLRKAGVDLTASEPFQELIRSMDELLDRFEEELGRLE